MDILACESPIGPGFQAFWDDHAIALDSHVFLHKDGVRPFGHRRAGEDSNGFTRFEWGYRFRTCGEPARDGEFCVAVGTQVCVPDGVAIDCRIVEGRQIDRCLHIYRDNAAACLVQRHFLGFSDRDDPLADQPLHIVEPEQRPGECKAIVGQLRHYRPLAATVASTAPMATARASSRSAIASMSLRSITGTFACACANATSDATAMMCGSSG